MRFRALLVVATAVVLLIASSTISVATSGSDDPDVRNASAPMLAVVGEDPYMQRNTYHRTIVEPDSFSFGSTIVSTFQAGRARTCGASNLGWSVSRDSGLTWDQGFLPGTTLRATPPGPLMRATDPVVTYDAKHAVWLVEGFGPQEHCGENQQLFVSRSSDDAASFGEPIVIGPLARTFAQSVDKPWLACDNSPTSAFYGNCYTAWAHFDAASIPHMRTMVSADGGLTWTKGGRPTKGCQQGIQLVVQPDGALIVLFSDDCDYRAKALVSSDGGLSFDGPFRLPLTDGRAVAGGLIAPNYLSADIDARGTVYAVWPDCSYRSSAGNYCTHNDLVLSTSEDGRSWTDKVRIPIDPVTSEVDHFLPALAVDPTTSGTSAQLAVLYYFYPEQHCKVGTCQLSVGFISSTDGGSTWSDPVQLAGPFEAAWLPVVRDGGHFVGDYFSVSFADHMAVPVFTMAAEGDCQLGEVTSCNVWTASARIPLG